MVSASGASTLGFPRTSPATLVDSVHNDVTFVRASAGGLTDSSRSGADLGRASAAAVADSHGLELPGSSSLTFADLSVGNVSFGRAVSGTIADTGEVFSLGTPLPQGWSTFSVPVSAINSLFFASSGLGTSAQNGVVDPGKVSVAFRFDAENQTWRQILLGETVSPMDGVMLKSIESHTATLILDPSNGGAHTKPLYPRWNLIGPSTVLGTDTKPADQVLSSVFDTQTGEVGYMQVVSPLQMTADALVWDRGQPSPPGLERWRAYWVLMDNAATLIGEASSPVQ